MCKYNINFQEAKQALLNHKVICFPTETVMGLGVLFNDLEAYNLLNIIKRRPEDKPYTMMVGSKQSITDFAFVDNKVKRVINKFMPGSLTLILKAKDNLPNWVTHGHDTIGIRIPSNKAALKLLKYVNIPLLVPSANRSGEAPALTSVEAKNIFGDEISAYIDGESISSTPSTIVDFTSDSPKLIRQGEIQFQEILKIFNK